MCRKKILHPKKFGGRKGVCTLNFQKHENQTLNSYQIETNLHLLESTCITLVRFVDFEATYKFIIPK